MPLRRTSPPPRSPMLSQTTVAFFGTLIRSKERDTNIVALQDIRNQGSNLHMSGIEGQIHRLFARCQCYLGSAERYQDNAG